MATTFKVPKNNATTTLNGGINDSTETVVVADGGVFPSTFPFPVTCESEIMLCTARTGNTLTCTRAQEDTSAAAHLTSTAIELLITAKFISDLNTAVNAIEAAKGAVSGYASLNASTKVTEQPAAITDHLEGSPTEDLATKAPTSEWAYDHANGSDPHSVYRLESADHTHQSTGLQGGKIDHGAALSGLTNDDHTQYMLRTILTTRGDLMYQGAAAATRLAKGSASQRLRMADSNDPGWVDEVVAVEYVIDGGGSAISTGVKGYIEVPFAGTITAVTLLADQSGSIVVDIWKDTYANYPPTDADTITASAVPTISSATKYQDSTLTGWTTAITAGDILGYNVDSCTTITRCTVSLRVKKS